VPLHRIRREVSDPHRVGRCCEADCQDAVGIAGVLDPHPFVAVGGQAGVIAGPAVGIGRAAAIGDPQRQFAAFAAGHPEIEPLVEVGQVILDDLEIGPIPVLVDDADVAGVERARNRDAHETFGVK